MASIFAIDTQWTSTNFNLHISTGSKFRLVGENSLILIYCGLINEFLLISQVGLFVEFIKNLTGNLFKATTKYSLEQVK
ncbi:hypothetical protein AYO04_17705 [Raoultella planticola]|nr:hypothetical protein AYO05_02335 [Raoultella planticola]OAZ84855.1 hypothetical protein AYO04_17705 [Raoultella planticola]